MKANTNSKASVEFDITRPLELTHGPMQSNPKTGEKAIYIYSTALDGVNPIRVATVAFGLNIGLSDEQEEALMSRIADAIVTTTPDAHTVRNGGLEEASMALIEAAQMSAGVKPNRWKEDEAYLQSGTGEMWEVRVISSHDDLDWCDFHVRADTMEEAAVKAEVVARRNSDMYFDEPSDPRFYADRHNISRLDGEGD